jgi:hypothetical protein
VLFYLEKEKTMALIEGIRQIRVLAENDDGSANGSATAVNSTMIQSMDIAPAYIDGAEIIQRGGDAIKAVVKEDDNFLGVNITLNLAAVEATLKALIVGGAVEIGTDGNDKWIAPREDTEMPYPFRLIVWQAVFTESDSESTQDGFIEHEFSYCKRGRLGSRSAGQQAFSNEQYTLEARCNESDPSNIEGAWTHDEVDAIV